MTINERRDPSAAQAPHVGDTAPVYCCVPIEFIQPWEQNDAIRKVKELGLGNCVLFQGTFHVGNRDADRAEWKRRFPHLAEKIDAVPRFPDRPEHGMAAILRMPVEFRVEQLRLCRELGLSVVGWGPGGMGLMPEDTRPLAEAGLGVVLDEMIMGESTSVLAGTLTIERLRQMAATPVAPPPPAGGQGADGGAGGPARVFDEPDALDFRVVHDWFVGRFRTYAQQMRAATGRALSACEASAQIRLAMEAGADIPIFELVPSEPLRGLAATRGAARAYGKQTWGIHAAMGYYRAPTDAWTPERLRIAYDLFFIGGASFFSEPNIAMCNWGSCSAFFTIPGSPAVRWAERERRGFDDPICVRGREVLAEHFRFTRFHRRPATHPRVRLGFVLGYLDGWTGHETEGGRMWMVDHPGFLAPDAVATWRHFERVYESEPWYIPPRKYYWQADPAKPLRHGTPPCGQVDIVPIEAPAEVFNGYGCLAMLGWNTMTEANYVKLRGFVEAGGTLFLSVPHLSTRTRTDRPQEFIRGGDPRSVRDLCGVKILGPGATVEEVSFEQQTRHERYVFPQGTLYLEAAPLAALELHGARVLAHPRGKPEQPVLVEHRVGKGVVYLLATWEYPGHRLDAFITDVLRTLAEGEQGDLAVEGRDVYYAVYDGRTPSGEPYSTVYLVSHDIYGQPAHPRLLRGDTAVPLRVAGTEMRIAWVLDGLVVSPMSRWVKMTDASRAAGGAWRIEVEAAQPGRQLVQVAAGGGRPRGVRLDGVACEPREDREGAWLVEAELTHRHRLEVAG